MEYPDIGGDGRFIRAVAEPLGFDVDVIPTRSVGSLIDNARIICEYLRASPAERIVLVSLSKGGADVKIALRQHDAAAAFDRVTAWADFCGITSGTAVANRIIDSFWLTALARIVFLLRGHDFQFVRDLAAHTSPPSAAVNGNPLAQPLVVPDHMRVVHAVGFPLQRHLTAPLLRKHYRRLSPLGPNDAFTLLAHTVDLPGPVFPIWGADHYLRPASDLRPLAAALLLAVDRDEATWTRQRSGFGDASRRCQRPPGPPGAR